MGWRVLSALLAVAGCNTGFRGVDAGPDAGLTDASSRDERVEAAAPDAGWTLVYEDPEAEATESLNAIWVAGRNQVFSAGDNGQLVTLRGTEWNALNKAAGVGFYGLWGRSATDVFAVGLYAYNGSPVIFRYDGDGWSQQGPIPAPVTGLSDAWGIGTQLYLVGAGGHIFEDDPVAHPTDRYHLATVTGGCPDRANPSPTLWSIDGSGLDNILVGGDDGLLAHFDQVRWTRLCHPDPSVSYRAVFRLPASTDFMLGTNFLGLSRFSGPGQPQSVIHEDRASSGADQLHIWSIWASSPARVLAVGDAGTILYWDGGPSAARRVPSPTTDALFGISGNDDSEIYVCGQRNRIWRGRMPAH